MAPRVIARRKSVPKRAARAESSERESPSKAARTRAARVIRTAAWRDISHDLRAELPRLMPSDDGARWVTGILHHGEAVLRQVAAEFVQAPSIVEAFGTNTLTAIGAEVSLRIRREILRESLIACAWNLTHAAALLGIPAGAPSVIRMINDLGLSSEYEAAKQAGLTPRGRRPGKRPDGT